MNDKAGANGRDDGLFTEGRARFRVVCTTPHSFGCLSHLSCLSEIHRESV